MDVRPCQSLLCVVSLEQGRVRLEDCCLMEIGGMSQERIGCGELMWTS